MIKRFLMVCICCILACIPLSAVMEWKYEMKRKQYLEKRARLLQQKSPLVLKIRVLGVTRSQHIVHAKKSIWQRRLYTVLAEVVRVVRGEYPYKKIIIRYFVKEYYRGAVGPMIWNPKLMKADKEYTAWLKWRKGSWRAAAGMLSFK